MNSLLRCSVLATIALGFSLCWGEPGVAQIRLKKKIDDQANMFSEKAVGRATEEISAIERQSKHQLYIQTVEHPPVQFKDEKDTKYAGKWAEGNFEDLKINGVYVLICKDPHLLEVVVGNRTYENGVFTKGNRNELYKLLKDKLKKGPNKDGFYDDALESGVAYVRTNMKPSAPPIRGEKAPAQIPAQVPHRQTPEREVIPETGMGGNIMGWVCLGLVALVVIWLVFALIRAVSGGMGGPGMGRPGMGYGGGGYGGGGYGGGGGGGFFSGMLGGMFGAVAGNWMYNNFFGGSHGGGWGAGTGAGAGLGDSGGARSDEPADTTGSAEGGDWNDGGGDAGGDAGGGDTGGGDWGGGDVGGGGDTGGGDWGGGDVGGGGGDFGGGGGDFGGGGGGGGDW